ncbi:Uma2 family endonuclease [Aureimonas leprariae]|uniref:Uma2 family endonuclease n=1 Tax=Plantimonas leprariae TaxID=2615207 RepID=A0A7V7TVZ0_9HYPH|nr:Uma2 family endonuclease [Aureimonas leprariae]KAB0679324.1 Uma2 family endonuclease [Aureimonas leprariae]
MNIQLPQSRNWTADEFLHWAQAQEGKLELVDGRIVDVMINVTRSHVRLASRLMLLLGTRLDPAVYDIGSADFGIRVSDKGVRFPDVFVDRAEGGDGRDLAARAPVLLAEVLSPSSYARDFGPKVAEYIALPTLLHYLVLSPDEPRVWVWSRNENGAFGEPGMIEGTEAVLELSGLGLALPLADLYRGIA